MRLTIITSLLLCAGVAAADLIPADRIAPWQGNVGVPGGIPYRTTIYTNFSSGATYAQIQAALNSCPSNQVVKLGPGGYSMGGNGITIADDGVTLRGSGESTVISNCASIAIGNWQNWSDMIDDPTTGNHVTWSSGHAKGMSNITVSSASGYSVGQIILLDQLNNDETTAFGSAQGGAYAGDEYISVAYPSSGRDRYQFQLNKITAVSGTNITLSCPVYMPNWTNDLTPQVWRFPNLPVRMSGVEDLCLTNASISMHLADSCWFSNNIVHRNSQTAVGAIFLLWTFRCSVVHNYYDYKGVADWYGIQTRVAGGVLVENNIGNNAGSALMPNGSTGGVWAYNVITNTQSGSTTFAMGLLQHGGNPNMNLYEGNYVPCIGLDNTWGSSHYNVAFRNRAHAVTPGTTDNIEAVSIMTSNNNCSVAGNVLGTTDATTWYEDYFGSPDGCHTGGRIYQLGFWDTGCQDGGHADTAARDTLFRAVNWTSATATNGGIVLDGYTINDLPDSYYLDSKPSWFGNLTWPPVDPASPVYSSSYTNIPAGYRDVYDTEPPEPPSSSTPMVWHIGELKIIRQ